MRRCDAKLASIIFVNIFAGSFRFLRNAKIPPKLLNILSIAPLNVFLSRDFFRPDKLLMEIFFLCRGAFTLVDCEAFGCGAAGGGGGSTGALCSCASTLFCDNSFSVGDVTRVMAEARSESSDKDPVLPFCTGLELDMPSYGEMMKVATAEQDAGTRR